MIPAIIISIAFPLGYLYIVRQLDLYASGSFKTVLICFLWGFAAFFLAIPINRAFLAIGGLTIVITRVAPIIEEILKSSILVYYVRRPNFTYFVDGAIFGFAAGTGFTVMENLLYLSKADSSMGLAVALTRVFSTSLLHGSTTALVGVSLGRLRFGRGYSRIISLVVGLAAAMTMHLTFNNIITANQNTSGFFIAALIGFGGLGLNALFITLGLREERQWIRETLKMDVGVSATESNVVQQMGDLDTLLAPIKNRFGDEKRKQVETFLRLEAQIGLKRKTEEMTPDPHLRDELNTEIIELRKKLDVLRREVGVYCMSYVRSILPPSTEPIWTRLSQSMGAQETTATGSLWNTLGGKMGGR